MVALMYGSCLLLWTISLPSLLLADSFTDRVNITTVRKVQGGETWLVVCRSSEKRLGWKRNGIEPDATAQITESVHPETGDIVSELRIPRQRGKSGNVTCYDRSNSSNVDTIWFSDWQSVEITTGEVDVAAGNEFTLRCRGKPETRLSWTFNGRFLDSSRPDVIITSTVSLSERLSTLTVDLATVAWEGMYTCVDSLDTGNFDSVEVKVSSDHAGNWISLEPSEPLEVQHGQSFTLRCEAGRSSSIVWSHNGEQLGDNVQMMTTMTMSGVQVMSVRVPNARQQDTGTYACDDRNDATVGASVFVRVHPPASTDGVRILSPRANRIDVEIGEPFTLICDGSLSSQPTWYHNGIPLSYEPNLVVANTMDVITRRLVLILTRLSPDAAASGRYSCRDQQKSGSIDDIQVTVGRESDSLGFLDDI